VTRELTIGAAQLGPISRSESRVDVVERLLALLRKGAEHRCDLVVFPELALTTFFPRWLLDDGGDAGIGADTSELDSYYETEMPNPAVQRLFDEAKRLGVGFHLGYAELTPPDDAGVRHRYNASVLVDGVGQIVGKSRQVRISGPENEEPWWPVKRLALPWFGPSPATAHLHSALRRPLLTSI